MYFRVFWNQRAVSVTPRRPVAAEPEHVPVREGVCGDRVAAGIAASVPFWDQGHPIPVGWFPKHYPQIGDLSFFVGFVIAATVYLALNTDRIRLRLQQQPA